MNSKDIDAALNCNLDETDKENDTNNQIESVLAYNYDTSSGIYTP